MSRANQPSLPPVLEAMSSLQGAVLGELVRLMASAGFPEVRLPQANLLTSIPLDTGARMSELAARLRLTRGAVTQLVLPLEEAGLVTREPDPTDRRGVLVRPTAKALRGYRITYEWTVEKYQRWEELVGTERWRTFCAVLHEIEASEVVQPRRPGASPPIEVSEDQRLEATGEEQDSPD